MPPEMTDISNYCATLGHKVILVVMMEVVLVESMCCCVCWCDGGSGGVGYKQWLTKVPSYVDKWVCGFYADYAQIYRFATVFNQTQSLTHVTTQGAPKKICISPQNIFVKEWHNQLVLGSLITYSVHQCSYSLLQMPQVWTYPLCSNFVWHHRGARNHRALQVNWPWTRAVDTLKGKKTLFFYSTIGSELAKLRQVTIGNFHRKDQKLVKSSF